MNKKLFCSGLLAVVALLPAQIRAQETTTNSTPETFTLVLSQDNALGFNPAVYGSFGIGKDGSPEGISLTYYGVFWTNPGFGTLIDGSDLWLETGVGIGFTGLDNRLFINPTIALTHGKLLSDSPRSTLAEGIVPGLNATFKDGRLEAELSFSYYKALRNEGNNAGDYLRYWVLPGIRISNRVSLGMHYERFERVRHARGDTGRQYAWLGGYLKFNLNDRYIFRFSGGVNSEDNGIYSSNFYKLTAIIPLL